MKIFYYSHCHISSFLTILEYAEVYLDCPVGQSPSNRPPAMLPPDANLPNQNLQQSR